ncbi:MAG: Protein-L-isoaspartate O-methyltransferase [Lentisphaerae bacterium ADurb.BinA184]|nr:MAG: Protein-L-isoaspartate O-methyltransferase [Lentisphaerae bacterium ADurb.BinA184]
MPRHHQVVVRPRIATHSTVLPLLFGCLLVSCSRPEAADDDGLWQRERQAMVDVLRQGGIEDPRVLAAMGKVRRHVYIPPSFRKHGAAYGDHPWPIGHDQTISQPFIVAYMTQKLGPVAGGKVLEIGTGSGYQAAVLAELGARVYTIEIIPQLAEHARRALAAEGYADAVHVLAGDGYKGWPAHAPFDAIIVTCAPEEIPQALVDQLKEGGRMILPLGSTRESQRLVILKKVGGKAQQTEDLPVRFVPMVKGKGR